MEDSKKFPSLLIFSWLFPRLNDSSTNAGYRLAHFYQATKTRAQSFSSLHRARRRRDINLISSSWLLSNQLSPRQPSVSSKVISAPHDPNTSDEIAWFLLQYQMHTYLTKFHLSSHPHQPRLTGLTSAYPSLLLKIIPEWIQAISESSTFPLTGWNIEEDPRFDSSSSICMIKLKRAILENRYNARGRRTPPSKKEMPKPRG